MRALRTARSHRWSGGFWRRRRAGRVGGISDLLAGRREARRQHQRAAVRKIAVIGTILVHDGEALGAPRGGPALGYVDDPRIEIAVLSGDALIDRVRDDMRN